MNRLADIWRDRQGAVLVKGIVMMPILAAGLWYETVAWKDIVAREQVQIAADVTAAGGASWLAAGMNILALINVIMSIILTAFVVIRVVEILCLAGALFFFGLSFVPFMGWAMSVSIRAAQWGEKAFEYEQKYAPKIMRALNVGTEAERVVSRAFPYISTAMSVTMATENRSGSWGLGVAGNMSLAPTALDRLANGTITIPGRRRPAPTPSSDPDANPPPNPGREPLAEVDGFPERMGSIRDDNLTGNGSLPQRLASLGAHKFQNLVGSLPVEEEGYPQLCARAAGDWTNFSLVKDLPFFDRLGMVMDFLGGNLTTLMCQPFKDAKEKIAEKIQEEAGKALKNKAAEVAGASCTADEDAGRLQEQANHSNRRGPRHRQARLDSCIASRGRSWERSSHGEEFRENYERDERAKLESADAKVTESTDSIRTAKLWSFVNDGAAVLDSDKSVPELEPNMFLSAYAIYHGPEVRSGNVGEIKSPAVKQLAGLAIGGSAEVANAEGFEVDWSSARARMYFDCRGTSLWRSNDEDNTHSCADNSMWRPGGWQWVLGRDRSPIAELGETARQAFSGYLGFLTGGALQSLLGAVVQPLIARGESATVSGSGSHFTKWIQRLGSTATHAGGQERLGANHASDWWLGNLVGDAAYDGVEGEWKRPKGYFR